MSTTKACVSLTELATAIEEASRNRARGGNTHWHYVRVYPDGEISVGEEASRGYVESEYFGRKPHPITVWGGTAGEAASPGDGGIDWDDAAEESAEFFAAEAASGCRHGRDWCYPDEREEYPHCMMPKVLGSFFEPDFSSEVDAAVELIEDCDWLEVA